MIAFTLAVVLILVVALAMTRLTRPSSDVRSLADVAALSQPVDLDSFRNLIDSAEEAYLRSNLPTSEFRKIQRGRMVVAIRYVRSTAHNAALLLKLSQYAQRASDPEVVKAARDLANSAMQLRVYSLVAMLVFCLRYAIPSLPLRASSIVVSYGRMCDHMSGLTRMQTPTSASEIESAL